jgi:hypothetical protein
MEGILAAVFFFFVLKSVGGICESAGRKLRALRLQMEADEEARKARLIHFAAVEPLLLAPPSKQVERQIYRN